MFSNSRTFRQHAKVVSLSAILLTLWLNWAFVDHQLDASLSHHSHHHCQLFSSAGNALSPSIPEIPVWISHNYIEPAAELLQTKVIYFAYLARSPPIS